MQYRPLGATGIQVSAVAFGAGPVSGLMTGDKDDRQTAVVARAIEIGVNWFDTAATYGGGQSERSLGRALAALDAGDKVHLASKVRFTEEDLADIRGAVRRSVTESLARLRVERLALLQIHNSITARHGDEPTSITPDDVLRPGGVLDAFDELREEGLLEHAGMTAIGQAPAILEVIESGRLATIQVPYNLLNRSAGQEVESQTVGNQTEDANYGNIMSACAQRQMGVFAIRVFAAGALIGQPPSRHTHKTKFFPLELYERDTRRAADLARVLAGRLELSEAAVRFVLGHDAMTSAIIGFGEPNHVDAAVKASLAGPLPAEVLADLDRASLDQELLDQSSPVGRFETESE